MGRLLNATDGVIARNSQAIVLLTTNGDPAYLHPAVLRAGRCLSNVEFSNLRRAEAAAWCRPDVSPPDVDEISLADLYAFASGATGVGVPVQPSIGMYL